jgi:hypothetical protein
MTKKSMPAVGDISMVEEQSWDEFRKSGMVWWINRILHTFGWAITMELDDEGNVSRVYPARCKFRGFSQDVEEAGFKKISKYMKDNIEEIENEANE